MNKQTFPGFTVLVERALRLSCVLGVVALAACGGGNVDEDSNKDAGTTSAKISRLTTDGRSGGIVLSEKSSTTNRPRGGIILTEKAQAPEAQDDADDAGANETDE